MNKWDNEDMESLLHIKEALRTLRRDLGYDFAAFASVTHDHHSLLSWVSASGNRSDKYRRIVLEPGKGIAGVVYRKGKPIIINDVREKLDHHELVEAPILLAEDLSSLAALPLFFSGKTEGVLLLALRRKVNITEEMYRQITERLQDGFCGMNTVFSKYEEILNPEWAPKYESLPIYELTDLSVLHAVLRERRRIAQDLHDGVIQDILGVQMQLRTLKYCQTKEDADMVLREADLALTDIQKELRQIMRNVQPDILEEMGLMRACKEYIRFLRSSYGTQIEFTQNIGRNRYKEEVETIAYRIFQEAAGNACRHAQCSCITVSLMEEEDSLSLSVRDDGSGFDPNVKSRRENSTGMGLPGMQYWALMIDADYSLSSAPGKGTTMNLRIPLRPGHQQEEL